MSAVLITCDIKSLIRHGFDFMLTWPNLVNLDTVNDILIHFGMIGNLSDSFGLTMAILARLC